MRSISFEIPVMIGNTKIELPAMAWYILDGGFSPTEIDPGEPPIEIRRVTVNVNDVDIDIEWRDDPWVDDLCTAIYEEHNI